MTGSCTAMAREIAEIPAVVSRQAALGLDEYRAVGAHLRRLAPAVIVTCARGSSDNASVYLKYLVETRIGIPVAAVGPSVASVYDARLSLDRAVCVTISQSGGSPDLVSLQDHAHAGGAETLALLNTPESPVGSAADEVVPVMAGPETAVAATKSLVASLVAIAGIVAGWTGDDDLARGLEALPESLAASLSCRWEHALPAVAGANSLYVIGRGPGYAIAREAALKLKETCRLHAEAYSAAEVRHGPIAIARSRPRDWFVALMFHARDASRASLEQACAAMRGIGAPVFVADAGEPGADVLPVAPAAHPLLDPICVDALRAGHALLAALWEHDRALRAGEAHDLLGGRFLLVTHVRSGESIAVPERFELSLIRKLLPGDDLDQAADALSGIAARIACKFFVAQEVRFTAPRDHPVGGTPDEVPADHPGVAALARSIRATTGMYARIEGAPYWSEKPLLHAAGIPGIYFAAGDIACCHTAFERLPVDQLVAAARTLAHFVVSWCGVREDTQATGMQ